MLVSVTLENKKENAYNTSLSLSFSRNLHLTSLTPQVPWRRETGAKEERRRETRTSAMGCCGQKCGSSPLPALTSPPSLCLQRAKSVKVECAVPSPHARLCIVGHPVFQAGAKVSMDSE